MKKLLTVLLAVIVLAFGVTFMSYNSDVKGSSKDGTEITVDIPEGTYASKVGEILRENGVIKNKLFFKFYIKTHPADNLQYGQFTLNTSMSYDEIIQTLSSISARRETVTVTFPEGFSLMQIAQRMENNGLCTAEEFIDVANNGDFSQFEFWSKIKEHDNKFMKAEGYLYPDTYEFYKDDSVYNMVCKFYENFEERISAVDNAYRRMDEIGMSLDEVVTLASFVQEEAGHEEDQPAVAACLRNRLLPGSPYPRLECNVCSYINEPGNYVYDYIVEYYGGVENVPRGMMEAYNTYDVIGLPPGPISNPGITAIKAVLWPDENYDGYYFFVTDAKGVYRYAKTYREHIANCEIASKVK